MSRGDGLDTVVESDQGNRYSNSILIVVHQSAEYCVRVIGKTGIVK